ncbi:G5 domain-containing protein [uncultured Arcanobacterium sp.]|uniref:G5 domain-containing protein n=1 Tax=uncultured Arcanobacterium sp. TaxID=487520 RepID=UPI0026345EFA|nr:G5 domain-containing protein [uncultured Arcanobacterium sp.]
MTFTNTSGKSTWTSRLFAFVLALALAFTGFAVFTATQAQAEDKTAPVGKDITIGLRWKPYADTPGQACNPEQAGKSAGKIAFYLDFVGKNKETGKREKFYSKFFTPDIQYCKDVKIEIKNTDEIKDVYGKKTYTELSKPLQVYSYVDGKNYPGRVRLSANLIAEPEAEPDAYWITMTQAANLDVNSTKLTGIIAPKDENKLKVRTSFDMQKKGEERKVYKSWNRRWKMEGFFDFKDNQKFSLISLKDSNGNPGYKSAISSSDGFHLWNEYAGKYRDYFLQAAFADPELAKAKYYSLEVSGNDIAGWNIELKSKLQKKEYDAVKNLPYEEERRANPNMPTGEEKVVQKGVAGAETTKMVKYYYDDSGEEKIVEEKTLGDPEVKAAVNQIVEYGTGAKAEAKKPALPRTGTAAGLLALSSLLLLAGGGALALRRR